MYWSLSPGSSLLLELLARSDCWPVCDTGNKTKYVEKWVVCNPTRSGIQLEHTIICKHPVLGKRRSNSHEVALVMKNLMF